MTTKHAASPLEDNRSATSPGRGKRQKVTRACDHCKTRKRRCNGELPCTACHTNGASCTYLASYTRGRLVQPTLAAGAAENETKVPTLITQSLPYCEETTNGIETLKPSRANSPEISTNHAGQYLGPTSPYTFLRRAWKRFEDDGSNVNLSGDAVEERAEPIYMYGDRQSQIVEVKELVLPDKTITARLLEQYFDLGMPTYRFMHKPSVLAWLQRFHQLQELGPSSGSMSISKQAVVLMVLATARLLNIDDNNEWLSPTDESYVEGERLFRMGQTLLEKETGRTRLESVQARLAEVLYLLHTSRPNQAWYKFGTVAQLTLALGLHRFSTGGIAQQDAIARECRKRVFWATSTIDTYLSIVFGRPALIHLHDVDQKFPDSVEDEDLTAEGVAANAPARDSIMKASILHGQMTKIVKKAAQEQSSVLRKSSLQKLEAAVVLNAEVAAWKTSLPVVLSGAIHPSSLIPIFRRQVSVLHLAHSHALMLINRPSLLMETNHEALKHSQVESCLSAAMSTLNTVLAAGMSGQLFKAFWHTQFISFNALSIIYVWQILRKQGRLPAIPSVPELELTRLAEAVQCRLDDASEANAPSLRYSIVLQELQQEVSRLNSQRRRPPHMSGLLEAPNSGPLTTDSAELTNASPPLAMLASTDTFLDAFGNDFPLDPDLWLSLDAFPFSDFGQFE